MANRVGTVGSKGQVTIPKDIRDALGILPGDKVRFDLQVGKRAVLRKAELSRMTEILGKLGPSKPAGVPFQRSLRRAWSRRRH
ncbi:MAG: AbrB/MazE/SpoVT family DNA-binding domain-containing protein [Thermoplasmata archaeon]